MQVPVKTGRLCTGAYLRYSPIQGSVFEQNDAADTSVLPSIGGLSTKPNPIATASPIANHYNISTQKKVEPKIYLNNLFAFHPSEKPRVQPQMRSILPMRKVEPVVHMSNGGSPNMPSDTAFHPINRPAPIPKITSERDGERIDVPSFTSHSNLWYDQNNSFYRNQAQVGSDRVGRGRWHVVDKGAVK